MPKYKLIFGGRRKDKCISAPTKKKAMHKFLGSPYHFRTEAYPNKVILVKKRRR